MKQRIISALIASFICIPLVLLGGIWFYFGVSIIGVLGLKEFLDLNDKKLPNIIRILSYIVLTLLILSNYFLISFEKSMSISILLLFVPIIFLNKEAYNINIASKIYGITIFLGFVLNKLCEIRVSDIYLFLFLILIPMITDIFAYIVGSSKYGKTKLVNTPSPNKTVEGTLAGLVLSTIVCTIIYIYEIDPSANILSVLLMVFILSVSGQIGDFTFSAIKRYYKIKDFSNIMPGHGGILDRIDSTIFVFLTYVLFL